MINPAIREQLAAIWASRVGDWREAEGVTRGSCIDHNIEAEKAIRAAIAEVEKIGADPEQTAVVVELGRALDRLSRHLDEQTKPSAAP